EKSLKRARFFKLQAIAADGRMFHGMSPCSELAVNRFGGRRFPAREEKRSAERAICRTEWKRLAFRLFICGSPQTDPIVAVTAGQQVSTFAGMALCERHRTSDRYGFRRSRDMQEDRIQKLEILVTEHERTIEELSNQLTEHWATIDRLEKMLHSLAERFLTLEEAVAPEVPVTKPPHY